MCCRYKLSLTSLTTFIAPGTTLQVHADICLAGFFWIVDAIAQPFQNSAENALQIFAQGVIFFTLAIGGMVQTGGNNDVDANYKTATVDTTAVSTHIIFINAAVFVGAAALLWLNKVHSRTRTGRRRAPQIGASDEDSKKEAGSTVATRHSSCTSTPDTSVLNGSLRGPAKLAWQDAKDAVVAFCHELPLLAGGDRDERHSDGDDRSG